MPQGNIDAACQVAHAIGTHRLAPEYDYYTAVDDLQPEDTEGADMIGTIQFNASCLYRYAALDTSQLAANLGEDVDVTPAVAAFTRAFALAIPTGKQNTFAARNPPSAILGVRRAAGAWNLANAFITPIHAAAAEKGVATASTVAMLSEFASLQRMYGRADENVQAALLSAETVDVPAGVDPVEHLDALVHHVAAP
ncbi:MAG: type I-E CRISPR-associated protein Cas7/Cse4/CasC, partial [Gaiellaceae bacterium]